jgi:FkbM family methyltransferase
MLATLAAPRCFENWTALVRLYLQSGREGGEVILRLRDGGRLTIRRGTSDVWAVHEIFLRHDYRLPAFKPGRAPVVIDIGGNIGLFSTYVARSYPESQIFAYEPEPANFRMLCVNLEANGLAGRVTAVQKAVSDTLLSVFLHLNSSNVGGHSLILQLGDTNHIQVPATTLQEIVEQNGLSSIDLIKLDCEGSEYSILYSCPPAILAKIKHLIIEFHDLESASPRDNGRALAEFLQSSGFSVQVKRSLAGRIGYLHCSRVDHS